MAGKPADQCILDAEGKEISVTVLINLWHEMESERETAYVLKSENMKWRPLKAKKRQVGILSEDATKRLGMGVHR